MPLWEGRAPAVDGDGMIDALAMKRNVVAKTASYTVKASESGTLFTTLGATGAITFTLPAVADGLEFTFVNAVDQNMVIAGAANDLIVTFNNATADSISFATASEKIGGAARVTSDGTYWYAQILSTSTLTVTDA